MIDTLVLIDDTRTTIYHDIICDVTTESRQKIRQKQIEREPTTLLRSTICFWLLAFTLFLACPLSGLFCRHFVVHQLDTSSCYGPTVPPANSDPVPSQLGLLPERMFVFVSFIIFHLVTWYSLEGTKYSTWYIVVINCDGQPDELPVHHC